MRAFIISLSFVTGCASEYGLGSLTDEGAEQTEVCRPEGYRQPDVDLSVAQSRTAEGIAVTMTATFTANPCVSASVEVVNLAMPDYHFEDEVEGYDTAILADGQASYTSDLLCESSDLRLPNWLAYSWVANAESLPAYQNIPYDPSCQPLMGDQVIEAGESKTYQFTWLLPPIPTGTYNVELVVTYQVDESLLDSDDDGWRGTYSVVPLEIQ